MIIVSSWIIDDLGYVRPAGTAHVPHVKRGPKPLSAARAEIRRRIAERGR